MTLTASPDTLSAARERARLSHDEYWLHLMLQGEGHWCPTCDVLLKIADEDGERWDLADKRIAADTKTLVSCC